MKTVKEIHQKIEYLTKNPGSSPDELIAISGVIAGLNWVIKDEIEDEAKKQERLIDVILRGQ